MLIRIHGDRVDVPDEGLPHIEPSPTKEQIKKAESASKECARKWVKHPDQMYWQLVKAAEGIARMGEDTVLGLHFDDDVFESGVFVFRSQITPRMFIRRIQIILDSSAALPIDFDATVLREVADAAQFRNSTALSTSLQRWQILLEGKLPETKPSGRKVLKPVWNREDRTLSLGGKTRKYATQTSKEVFKILDAFEEFHWREAEDLPVSPDIVKAALRTINKQSFIRFRKDGDRIRWEKK